MAIQVANAQKAVEMPQRGPRTHRSVQKWIQAKIAEEYTAADVIREGPPEGLRELWPSDRTIQDLHKRLRTAAWHDPGDQWSLSPDGLPDIDPVPVLAALRVLATKGTRRRQAVSVEEARWISLIARVVPGITPEGTIEAMQLYVALGPSPALDLWLAAGGPENEPWWLWSAPPLDSRSEED